MIEHHAGAVEMSRIALAQNAGPTVAKLDQHTIDKQTKEVADLLELRQQGSPDPATSELYQPAMMRMHRAMMTATGADIDETYLLKMLEHHRGAVTMSDVALANDLPRQLRSTIQKTRGAQTEKIAIIEAMLRGAPMDQAMRQPATEPAQRDKDPSAARRRVRIQSPRSGARPSRRLLIRRGLEWLRDGLAFTAYQNGAEGPSPRFSASTIICIM